MSNHENEIIAESIYESALELLGELANETFGEDQLPKEFPLVGWMTMDEWCTYMISVGWVDRKMEELYEGYPEGPC